MTNDKENDDDKWAMQMQCTSIWKACDIQPIR